MADKRLRKLTDLAERLPAEQLHSLLEFAQYLVDRHGRDPVSDSPLELPRPETESVIQAIKRLSTTYPMLDPQHLLDETGDLMTQHVMQGRNATDVIDDLEQVFRRHYERFREQLDQ